MDQCGYEKLHVDPFWNFFVFFKIHKTCLFCNFSCLSPITRNSERRNWIFYDDGGFES